MKEKQRKIMVGIGALVFAMLIYPPYRIYGFNKISDSIIESGYAFILDLPDRATVDVATLFTQWVGVIIAGSIVFFLLKDK
jgi:hypothetical protein